MKTLFGGIYDKKRVLVTGHTGFKGSWLSLWLNELGAEVTGYALPPDTSPSHYELLGLPVESLIGDVRDPEAFAGVMERRQPEIVFHLAAQPLVRRSYKIPRETFETNIMGTVNVLEACRKTASVTAIINVTSDKCYENREWARGYKENDAMGGFDPYSASKGCSELITGAYRKSFFTSDCPDDRRILLASARAGNVIGGGDWAEDRLVPDLIRALANREKAIIRNPNATRPWQHILEPLSGYLQLGQMLLQGNAVYADSWNLGPKDETEVTVGELAERCRNCCPGMDYEVRQCEKALHEADSLKLDCSKANTKLRWKGVWDSSTAVDKTVKWYGDYYDKGIVNSMNDIAQYVADAEKDGIEWVKN
ncbi:CDP-glucose 4,6-dehydratase [Desulfosarcina alkanivorans]|nr:CDP-glucose 4,6-dehydratase [Desulfosarcina alkanivorans]